MTSSGTTELIRVLQRLNQDGNFFTSILTDSQGLSIASAHAQGLDPEKQAAIVAVVQKSANQAGKQLGMPVTDEIALQTTDGQRLISRAFQAGKYDLILSITVPPHQKSYRRLTNRAISDIRRIWARHWE
jgi:predicted regulator of Ras-like GTPase activity (Roadblock/LC7/MglB family)